MTRAQPRKIASHQIWRLVILFRPDNPKTVAHYEVCGRLFLRRNDGLSGLCEVDHLVELGLPLRADVVRHLDHRFP